MWIYCFYTDLFVLSSFIDFLFVEGRSSCFSGTRSSRDSLQSLPATASSLSSITSLKHGSQYATELPIFQPLTVSSFSKTEQGRTGHTEVFLAPQTSIFCILLARRTRLFFFRRHFFECNLLRMATA